MIKKNRKVDGTELHLSFLLATKLRLFHNFLKPFVLSTLPFFLGDRMIEWINSIATPDTNMIYLFPQFMTQQFGLLLRFTTEIHGLVIDRAAGRKNKRAMFGFVWNL